MCTQGEASAARESIMKGRNVLTDEDEAAATTTTTTSRRRGVRGSCLRSCEASLSLSFTLLRVVAPSPSSSCTSRHVQSRTTTSQGLRSCSLTLTIPGTAAPRPAIHAPLHSAARSFSVARSLVLAPAPASMTYANGGARANVVGRHDSPSADCGGRVVQCPIVPCTPMSLVISSRCKSTAYNSPRDVSSAWHGCNRRAGGRKWDRERERVREREREK